MQFSKFPLPLFRITTICLLIIVSVVMVVHQPAVDRLMKNIMTYALSFVDQQWRLGLAKTFIGCGHTETIIQKYLSEKALKSALTHYPGFQLKKRQNHFQLYINQINGYCSSCQNNHFLGLIDQKVVIFRGTPKKPGPIEEETPIKISDLPELELKDLEKGIPFKNSREKLQLIEGLKGLSSN